MEVREIANAVRTRAHTLTPCGRVERTDVPYAALAAKASRQEQREDNP
jgi:hypothetical protein